VISGDLEADRRQAAANDSWSRGRRENQPCKEEVQAATWIWKKNIRRLEKLEVSV